MRTTTVARPRRRRPRPTTRAPRAVAAAPHPAPPATDRGAAAQTDPSTDQPTAAAKPAARRRLIRGAGWLQPLLAALRPAAHQLGWHTGRLGHAARYRATAWSNRMARAWHRRTASDRTLGRPPLGRLLASELSRRLPSWLRPRDPTLAGVRDTPPPPGRLAGMCTWAALLGLLGLPLAGRALLTVAAGSRPDWSDPGMLTGVLGIGLAVAAFLVAHRRRAPWLLLGLATLLLAAGPRLFGGE
ncbi:hypothetical protein JQS43_19915 [Natronosporangium hydrolyticum]|uniref:Uncharacterized protein n=1 Tax=Natronosporangium hydrolyticum TaxID=2811111 RepID=A0A895Y8Z2_9ACTN|nr:hypothetical protein [Natronosporangium hydrolyticum]QSB13801.1 hypothetical protein JQS43_19915 [Natronosporangium hydrolyticum]